MRKTVRKGAITPKKGISCPLPAQECACHCEEGKMDKKHLAIIATGLGRFAFVAAKTGWGGARTMKADGVFTFFAPPANSG
jgi:hypothetical protein